MRLSLIFLHSKVNTNKVVAFTNKSKLPGNSVTGLAYQGANFANLSAEVGL